MTEPPPPIDSVSIADFDLVGFSGHNFNQVLGLREAAATRNLAVRTFIREEAPSDIAARLGALAILPAVPASLDQDGLLEALADARPTLARLFRELESGGIGGGDLVMVTSAPPQVILGMSQWLDTLPRGARPAVCFRFFGPHFFNFGTKEFHSNAWAYRFASRMVTGSPNNDRIVFTINDADAVPLLERLTQRQVFLAPVPKYYGTPAIARMTRDGRATVYVHANRSRAMPPRVEGTVKAILQESHDVAFLVRFCKRAFLHEAQKSPIDQSLIGRGVELLPPEQDDAAYLATIERSDIVLLPYDAVEYRGIVSGIFCEAAAMGKILIVPAGTWMAKQLSNGLASGIAFEGDTVESIVAAVQRALADRSELQRQALRCADPFREEYNCRRNLDRMIEIAAGAHDMRLPYVHMAHVVGRLGSRRYLDGGWSSANEPHGIWSDRESAALRFNLRPASAPLVFKAEILPFVARQRPKMSVIVHVNSVYAANWQFDIEEPNEGIVWRSVSIPAAVAATGDIRIEFRFSDLVSPLELGLSHDLRKLGIALRQFSLMPADDGNPASGAQRITVSG